MKRFGRYSRGDVDVELDDEERIAGVVVRRMEMRRCCSKKKAARVSCS